jgi:hypothetical protein
MYSKKRKKFKEKIVLIVETRKKTIEIENDE